MEKHLLKQIDHWAEVDPDRIAYDYLGEQNTYGELKHYSDALAAKIKAMGLPKGAPVIVFGGQKFEMAATFLGLSKSGHAYIPVDAHSPAERIAIIKKIAEPAACIAFEDVPFSDWTIPIIDKKAMAEIFNGPIDEAHAVTEADFVKADENYYILFTSGTTGVPKGVQISYNNLTSFLHWVANDMKLDFNKPVNFVGQPPYSFDLSVMYLYSTLATGGCLSILPPEVTGNFKELFKYLGQYKMNAWISTPSFVEICLLSPEFNEETCPTLTNLYFCGEELTNKTASRLKERFPHLKAYNIYGPTEATVAVTELELTDEILKKYPRLPIGWPKPDTPIVLVDEDNQPVPQGEDGELVILGPSVSKGYINNPEKTASAFIELDGQRAYKTGDLAQYDESGMLLYKGRVDFQIKLHGFRIELEDVDNHLNRVSHVAQALTVPRYGKDHKVQQMIAYIVPKDLDYADKKLELTKAIKEELSEIMMPYMMPNRFVFVDSLSLTQNGKLDRKKLISEVNGND